MVFFTDLTIKYKSNKLYFLIWTDIFFCRRNKIWLFERCATATIYLVLGTKRHTYNSFNINLFLLD